MVQVFTLERSSLSSITHICFVFMVSGHVVTASLNVRLIEGYHHRNINFIPVSLHLTGFRYLRRNHGLENTHRGKNLYKREKVLIMKYSTKCYDLSESSRFQNAILALIVINAVTIGLETFPLPRSVLSALEALDSLILYIFIIELIIRLIGNGPRFFRDSWNNFDFLIVLFSIAPASGPLSVLRVFRVFRALRLVSSMPEMQRMVEAMVRSLRGIMAISWLLVIVMYVFSVMGTMLFGDGGDAGEMYFGNLGLSLFSLFQIMTLESWSNGVARAIVDEQGWWAASFFIAYIISTSFTFLNMFIAVFTNTMAAIDIEDEDNQGFSKILHDIKAEMEELKTHIMALTPPDQEE